jgi:hypothetical protein
LCFLKCAKEKAGIIIDSDVGFWKKSTVRIQIPNPIHLGNNDSFIFDINKFRADDLFKINLLFPHSRTFRNWRRLLGMALA